MCWCDLKSPAERRTGSSPVLGTRSPALCGVFLIGTFFGHRFMKIYGSRTLIPPLLSLRSTTI